MKKLENKLKVSAKLKGFKHSNKSRENMSKAHIGKRSGHWKDGLNYTQRKEKLAGRNKPEQCEVCGAMGRICFDHNHTTGKFRGWICHRCNITLGMVKDNTETLLALVEYIKNN